MGTEPISSTVLHNVVVQEPGKRYVQKPKVIETLDFSKLKYEPQAEKVLTKTSAKSGILAGLKEKAGKLGGNIKSVGSKLIKSKGGKIGLIAVGAGALLLGIGALLKGCDNEKPVAPAETTKPSQPAQPDKPAQPAKPSEPAKPAIPAALPGEEVEGVWEGRDTMQCRDESGRTRDINGKLNIIGEYEKNPEELTITDNSSGSDHVYKFKKIGVNDKGQPIYKCVSMNDADIISENQYTLEWENEKTPKLIQHKGQDNYGIGLKVGKAPAEDKTEKKELVDIWINRMPGPGQKPNTLETLKEDAIRACQNKRPLTEKEIENINKCKNKEQIKEYLRSIGFNLGIAY